MNRAAYDKAVADYQAALTRRAGHEEVAKLAAVMMQEAAGVADAQLAEARQRLHDTWTGWQAKEAPHVQGRWTARVFDEDGMPEPQRIEAKCGRCNAEWRGTCTSGRVREQLHRFAIIHLHRDPITGKDV